MDVDEALLKLGTYNRWRMLTYVMICISFSISGCWHMMSIVFTGGEAQHYCKLSENETLNESVPLVPGKGKEWRYSQCTRYVNLSLGNETTLCPDGWTYDRQEFQETIVTEWDLVCEKNYLVETSQSVFSFGVMIGSLVCTSIADRFGRKPVLICCDFAMLILGICIAYSGNYVTFVVLRFFQGTMREGAGLVGIVMACELFPAVHRTFAGIALELFWATAWMTLALIGYLIRHWRYFQLAITLPSIWTISLIWLLPESIPWLVANDRIDEAEAILQKAVKHGGGVQLQKPLLKHHQPATKPEYVALCQTENAGSKDWDEEKRNTEKEEKKDTEKEEEKRNMEKEEEKRNTEKKKEKSTDCDSELIPLLCVHG